MRIRALIALVAAIAISAGAARAQQTYLTVVDDKVSPAHGPIQLATVQFGFAPDRPDELVCAAYIGNAVVYQDLKRAVALADQVFEEFLGPHCSNAAHRNKRDDLIYDVARSYIYFGNEAPVSVLGALKNAMLDGTLKIGTRIEYRSKNNIGRKEAVPVASEFERVSQPEIPVGPSLREPNMTAVPTEIEPGVTIGFENKIDHTYYNDPKPALLIFFQTQVPWSDKRAQRTLSQKVVRAYAADRLLRRELKGVTTGAFNEPRRSRFHFRLSYRYATDEDGDMDFENIPGQR